MDRKLIILTRTVFALLITFLLFFIGERLIDNKLTEVQFVLTVISNGIQDRISSVKSIVELSASMDDVKNGSADIAEEYLIKVVGTNMNMWSHMLMTDLQGTEYVHTEGSVHYGKTLKDREYFTSPRRHQKTIVAQPIFSVSTGRKIMAIGTPVTFEDKLHSVLVGFVHLKYISQLLNQNSYSKNSYLMMTNLDGTISAHPKEEYVLTKNINDLIKQQSIAEGISSRKTGHKLTLVDGVLCLVVYEPIKNHLLSVVMVIPIIEAYKSIFIISAVLMVVFFAGFIILNFWNRIQDSTNFGKKMAQKAMSDSLTGLHNRHWLDTFDMDKFCNGFITVLFFDIDNFKNFNDKANHKYGDEILKFVAQSMLSCTRPHFDVSIRYAGDEFMILFKDTSPVQVEIIARRLMSALSEYVNADGEPDKITISCGISSGRKNDNSLTSLISEADTRAYTAKKAGKDRICS